MSTTNTGTDSPATRAEFAVEMHCQSCKDKIAAEVAKLRDVRIVDIDVDQQKLVVELLSPTTGGSSVHEIQSAIESGCGLRTVVKGLGDSLAAVSEITGYDDIVGVVRFTQQTATSATANQCLADGVIDGLRAGQRYSLNVHEFGDLSGDRFEHLGSVYKPVIGGGGSDDELTANDLSYPSRGSFKRLIADCDLSRFIGRSLAISRSSDRTVVGAGIVARASTVGDNSKRICACSGRTLWDERAIKQEDKTSSELVFSPSDYYCPTIVGNLSEDRPLDRLLRSKWTARLSVDGVFNYKVTENSLISKRLDGRYGMIAVLNPDRHTKRRRPQLTTDLRQSFDENRFNFTRIKPAEILFSVQSSGGQLSGTIVVNQSPIEFCNALLVPRLEARRPQRLTADSLELAINLVAISGRQELKLGFNSLGAMASVNHQHWHLYYYRHPILIESLAIDQQTHRLIGWPIDTLVYEFGIDPTTIRSTVQKLMQIIDYCINNNIAYNLFVSRTPASAADDGSRIRVFVWPREPVFGQKDDSQINVAFCEFTGFFICKSREMFDTIDEELCVRLLTDVDTKCHDLQHLL